MRLAIATCRPLPEPDPDEPLLLDALRRAGHEPAMLAWNEGGDATGFDAVVLRSTWDYYFNVDAFRAWLLRASSQARLINPIATVLSNLHKSYLLELRARGVPIVPTLLIDQGSDVGGLSGDPADGWVVKPAVGASSWRTRAFGPAERSKALDQIRSLSQVADVLVQPFLRSVNESGERSLVWIDGEFTHKVTKRARFDGHDEAVSAAQPLTAEESSVGRAAMDAYLTWMTERPLYGRVDVMESDGQLLVSEVELTEPSLYFLQSTHALERFVSSLPKFVR